MKTKKPTPIWRELEPGMRRPPFSACKHEKRPSLFFDTHTKKLKRTVSRIACFDNGGRTVDCFTILYLDEVEEKAFGKPDGRPLTCGAFFASPHPCHPQGVGQHCAADPTTARRWAGKRIQFSRLPKEVRKCVIYDLNGFSREFRRDWLAERKEETLNAKVQESSMPSMP